MTHFIQELRIRFRADKRKYSMALGLLAVGLLLWGRLVIVERIPRTGYADPEATPNLATPGRSGDGNATASSGTTSSLATSGASPGSGGITIPRDMFETIDIRVPDGLLRNLFASSSPELSPPVQPDVTPPSSPKSSTDSSDKSEGEDLKRSRQMSQIEMEASSLRLESVMLGSRRSLAIISGITVGVGGKVNGFEVRSIADRRVTLIKDDVIVNLQMETPGQP